MKLSGRFLKRHLHYIRAEPCGGLAQVARAVMLSSFESDFGPFDQQLQHWSREVKNEISAALHNASAIERRAQSEERARAKAHRIWHRQRAKETELEMERLRSSELYKPNYEAQAEKIAVQQKRSLLDKLSDHDYNRPWTRARRQCVASTAQWLTSTKQFSDWVADPTSSLLCLTGKCESWASRINSGCLQSQRSGLWQDCPYVSDTNFRMIP